MAYRFETVKRILAARPEIAPGTLISILKDFQAEADLASGAGSKRHRAYWQAMLAQVRYVRRTVLTNKARWPAEERPVYEDYVRVLDAIMARMDKARDTINPDTGLTFTPEEFALTRVGKESKGACLPTRWQTWCPTEVALDLIRRMDVVRQGKKGRGHALFWTASDAKQLEAQAQRHRTTISNIRTSYATRWASDTEPLSNHPYGALWLCAARMAERKLVRLLNPASSEGPMWERVMPANFHALLTPEMRVRLRRSRVDPNDVDLTGLHDFYDRLVQRAHPITPEDLTPPVEEDDEDTTTTQD